MKLLKKKYFHYELEYYLQPGKWMNDSELLVLEHLLDHVNALSGRNFDYGVLDRTSSPEEQRRIFETANLCVIKDHGEPIGFFYNMILQEKPIPVIHAGLVMVAKNQGHDLIGYPYSYMTYLQFRQFGVHYYTSISSTPSIIGVFSDSFSNVWPSYRGNQIKPPSKVYNEILSLLEEKYVKKYFDEYEIDRKRFVLRSPSLQMGFETDLKKLSRYSKPEANYFCMFWLDYTKGEDLIQVGRVDLAAITKIKLFYSYKKLKSLTLPKKSAHNPGKHAHRHHRGKTAA